MHVHILIKTLQQLSREGILPTHLLQADLSAHTHLSDLALDSLHLTTLALELETITGKPMTAENFEHDPTLESIAEALGDDTR